jgi:hypothetical protein
MTGSIPFVLRDIGTSGIKKSHPVSFRVRICPEPEGWLIISISIKYNNVKVFNFLSKLL